jgi:hypothetical protein
MFLQADKEHHAPVILYNLARAEERLYHPQAAVDAYERYLAEVGATADFVQAAAVAIADLRARSSRVRIESRPPGARIFVDGNPLPEVAPTTVLLSSGTHHVAAEGDTWRASSDFEGEVGGQQTVTIAAPEPNVPVPPLVPPPVLIVPPRPSPPELPPAQPGPDGLVFGAEFIGAPFLFLGARNPIPAIAHGTEYYYPNGNPVTNSGPVFGAEAGMTAEIGYAFTPRAEILIRGLGTLGSTCNTLVQSHIAGVGPAISYRLTDAFWVGGSVLGGSGSTCRGTRETAAFDTTLALTTTLDFSLAVATHTYGQWFIAASIGYYFADFRNENPLFYLPVGFGARFF